MATLLDQTVLDLHGQNRRALAQALCSAIWTSNTSVSRRTATRYLQIYIERVNLVELAHFSPRSHRQVVALIEILKANPSLVLSKLRSTSKMKLSWLSTKSDESVDYCLCFAAALWRLFTVKGMQKWKEDATLDEHIQTLFGSGNPISRAELTFTAIDLRRIGQISVVRTQTLDQHVRYDEENKRLQMFDFEHHLKCGDHDEKVIAQIKREVGKSLALLYPVHPTESADRHWDKLWCRPHPKMDDLELPPLEVSRRAHSYVFFGERLDYLNQRYKQISAKTWSQKFFDHRDGNRWFETWVAVVAIVVMTFFFGSVSVVTSIWQLKIAIESSACACKAQ